MDRIYDAVIHREPPYGQNGVTLNDESLLDSIELTIRHVDLKRWMRAHYPEHRPRFLFSRSERIAHPFITLEAGQAMLIERQAMKAEDRKSVVQGKSVAVLVELGGRRI